MINMAKLPTELSKAEKTLKRSSKVLGTGFKDSKRKMVKATHASKKGYGMVKNSFQKYDGRKLERGLRQAEKKTHI